MLLEACWSSMNINPWFHSSSLAGIAAKLKKGSKLVLFESYVMYLTIEIYNWMFTEQKYVLRCIYEVHVSATNFALEFRMHLKVC